MNITSRLHNNRTGTIYNNTSKEIFNAHSNCLKILRINKNHIRLASTNQLINFDTNHITINIPMVFHLLDPALALHDIKYWSEYINKNIIAQLNHDYNISYDNYSKEYTNNVNKLFVNADERKKMYYLGLVNNLPKFKNLQWKFIVHKIIIKPIAGLTISSQNNDHIYSSTVLDDPELYLNIVIVASDKLLGFSGFAFVDRDPKNYSKIDNNYKHKNGILISTSIFLANKPPFTKYRTFTHEIGHWCGLIHQFDNRICKPTYGTVYDHCLLVKKIINGKETYIKIRKTPYAHIFENNNQTPNFYNFMDYTDDAQMCMFTHNQILEMINMLSQFRPNFVKYSAINKVQ